ncbi:hypothetical protein [Streptomyces orinoci]|uniref:Uncharacterized protein n=1 Tax=Streptomyces orinoci TaxID=67339 RepID=A0ABV3KAG5_STRON|nr:hypothetical protein [Streptomyces orinoci]
MPEEKKPRTALEEVLWEFEQAETDPVGHHEDDDEGGEAADALTPDPEAQESVQRRDHRLGGS